MESDRPNKNDEMRNLWIKMSKNNNNNVNYASHILKYGEKNKSTGIPMRSFVSSTHTNAHTELNASLESIWTMTNKLNLFIEKWYFFTLSNWSRVPDGISWYIHYDRRRCTCSICRNFCWTLPGKLPVMCAGHVTIVSIVRLPKGLHSLSLLLSALHFDRITFGDYFRAL